MALTEILITNALIATHAAKLALARLTFALLARPRANIHSLITTGASTPALILNVPLISNVKHAMHPSS